MIERPVEKGLRRPDSNRRYAAYETAALPLGYSAVVGKKLANGALALAGMSAELAD